MDLKVSGDKFSGKGGKCISDVEIIYHEKVSQLELPCEATRRIKERRIGRIQRFGRCEEAN